MKHLLYVHLFVPFHLMALKFKKFISVLNLYEAVTSAGFVLQLKLKYLLMKPYHNDTIKAKEVYIQWSFERYKGKLLLCI